MIDCSDASQKNGYPDPKAVETASAENGQQESNFQASDLSRDLLAALDNFPPDVAVVARRWCAENGAVYIAEVQECGADFVEYLAKNCNLSKQRVFDLVDNVIRSPGCLARTTSAIERARQKQEVKCALTEKTMTFESLIVCSENQGCFQDMNFTHCEEMDKSSYYSNVRPQDPVTPTTQRLLKKTDTVGLFSDAPEPSKRKQLKNQTKDLASERLDHGQTGAVFALKTGDKFVAVFKPSTGEGFKRRGIEPNQGYIREEAVYLVDRLSGSQAGVPVTSLAKLSPDGGEEVEGSVQGFVDEVFGFVEDYGIPRDVDEAAKFLCIERAEAVALLDMRIFNMDRHGGNLLLTRKEKPHSLGPIDHGCCLPPWWCLEAAVFDAWTGWHLLQAAPSQYAKDIAKVAFEKLEDICAKLKEIPLDDPSILTLRLCTLFVYIGVYELGLAIGSLASKLVREDYEALSWFEERVFKAAEKAGAKCVVREDDYGMKEIEVENRGADMSEEEFLAAAGEILRNDLKE